MSYHIFTMIFYSNRQIYNKSELLNVTKFVIGTPINVEGLHRRFITF